MRRYHRRDYRAGPIVRQIVLFTPPGAIMIAIVALSSCTSFGPSADSSTTALADASSEGQSDGRPNTLLDAGRFCERIDAATATGDPSRTSYCRDFDDDADILFDWNGGTDISAASSITRDVLVAATPPGSFRARIETSDGGCDYARALQRFDDHPIVNKVHVELDVRIGGQGTRPADGTSFFVIGFESAVGVSPSCLLIFSANDTSGLLHEQWGGPQQFHPMKRFPKNNAWTHIAVEIDRSTRALDVRVDGASAFDSQETLATDCIGTRDKVFIAPGMHCESQLDAPREVHIDDVVVTIP